ncbi:hypothetical protein ACT048_20605 [Ectopseudomonas khazarica]|uniref:hypothetical protein n=1 Tax=Ectopseudomonas khazarica TaxID=2502979 RepID=UPI0040343F39
MFPTQVCDAALQQLGKDEHEALQREAARRGLDLRSALMAVAMENLQQQLYALSLGGRRLELVKG